MIPRNVRSLYKTKLRLSNKLRKCKSKSRILAIRKRMINVELDIKNHYSKWNDDKEEQIFRDSKINKNILYRYIKTKQKSKNKIGPFKNNTNTAEALRFQYEKVFSTPLDEYKIKDINKFFNTECSDCEKQIPHECISDNQQNNEHWSHSLCDIYLSIDDILKSISKLPNNTSCGPDGVPAILIKECASELALPLQILWNSSMLTGIIPPN